LHFFAFSGKLISLFPAAGAISASSPSVGQGCRSADLSALGGHPQFSENQFEKIQGLSLYPNLSALFSGNL